MAKITAIKNVMWVITVQLKDGRLYYEKHYSRDSAEKRARALVGTKGEVVWTAQ